MEVSEQIWDKSVIEEPLFYLEGPLFGSLIAHCFGKRMHSVTIGVQMHPFSFHLLC